MAKEPSRSGSPVSPGGPEPDDAHGADSLAGASPEQVSPGKATQRKRGERKAVLLRLDPAIHAAIAHWASDEVRSVNAQIDVILRRALTEAGRLPSGAKPTRRPGRPPR